VLAIEVIVDVIFADENHPTELKMKSLDFEKVNGRATHAL
jgi:hypothetical protein